MADAPKSLETPLANAARTVLRVVVAILVSALAEVIFLTLFLLMQVNMGDAYDALRSFLPGLSALAGVPLLPFLKEKKFWFTIAVYIALVSAAMWFFQGSLLILWGSLTATGGGV